MAGPAAAKILSSSESSSESESDMDEALEDPTPRRPARSQHSREHECTEDSDEERNRRLAADRVLRSISKKKEKKPASVDSEGSRRSLGQAIRFSTTDSAGNMQPMGPSSDSFTSPGRSGVA